MLAIILQFGGCQNADIFTRYHINKYNQLVREMQHINYHEEVRILIERFREIDRREMKNRPSESKAGFTGGGQPAVSEFNPYNPNG